MCSMARGWIQISVQTLFSWCTTKVLLVFIVLLWHHKSSQCPSVGNGENECWANSTLCIFRQEKFMKSPVAENSYELICVSLCFLQVQTWPKA